MRVFAHSVPGDGDETRWEPLGEHLQAVAKRAAQFGSAFGLESWAQAAALLHDIGKTSMAFQNYILKGGKGPDHSTAGAVEARARYPRAGALLAFTIAGHHAGLADGVDLAARLTKQLAPYDGWETHTGTLPALTTLTFENGPYQGFGLSFVARMVFSCLVDADFLETEAFYAKAQGQPVARGGFQEIVALRDHLRATMAEKSRSAARTPLNELRATILSHAIGRYACPPGLFTMTVPTGGGKTLASLSFALEHAAHHELRRVIYVAPYTSIIEQTAQVFRDALGTDNDILEHHGNFDWDGAEDKAGEYDPDGLSKLRRATENWDAPVIVTTAVQFFESLFANRTSRCRKLHNIAGSVIVLDEVQTLPLKLLRPCMAALDELARNYGASIVLCTATQPALRKIDGALPPDKMNVAQGFDIGPDRELAPDPAGLYTALKRVDVEVLPNAIDDATIAARFADVDQMLCIVNSRAHAKKLFDLIQEQPGARHLTTLMCPAHRREVLTDIKADLKAGKPVRLVATSLVEAGVDFSFPEVWRAETGLDSIAQAAGRCNREGEAPAGRVVVFVPAEHKLPKAFVAYRDAALVPLRMPQPLGLQAVHRYFQELYFSRGFAALDTVKIDERPGILLAIERTPLNYPFASIAKGFRMIEETMREVIVPWTEAARAALAVLRVAEVPPAWAIRRLQQYAVSIPEAPWKAMLATGAIQVVNAKFGDRFLEVSLSLYNDSTGLTLTDPTYRTSENNIF